MSRTHKELKELYSISHIGLREYVNGKFELLNEDKYDVIVEPAGYGYGTAKYRILKNGPGLSDDELVEICERGGYSFGHRWERGNTLVIYID